MNSKHYIKYSITVLLCYITIICSAIISGCTPEKEEPIRATGFYFNTIVSITIYEECDENILSECFLLCEKYENLFSATIENSDIYRINHAQGAPCEVSPETIELLTLALEYAKLTNGKVDPTIYPVSSLWNFSSGENTLPDSSAIYSALTAVDYNGIQICNNTVTLSDKNAAIDLGFIAKGYIGDKIKDYLLSVGVQNALINLGGNIVAMGCKADGNLYHIGIEMPFIPGETAGDFTISDCSIVTSGVYERYFENEGILYHHLLDTSTGYPAETGLLSVTIFHQNSARADALSTTCFLLGPEEGLALIEETEGAEALFILSDYTIIKSSGLQ